MKYKHMRVQLLDIIPQQQYLSVDKFRAVKESNISTTNYGDIFVIEYRNKIFSVDGHHRLFWLYTQNVREIDVICERSDNDHLLYQQLSDEALEMGLKNISDLQDRFITEFDQYKQLWIDKCQKILKEIEDARNKGE